MLEPVVSNHRDVSPNHLVAETSHSEDGVSWRLSGRQRQVLALLAEGVTAKRIARRLDLAEPTVRNHIQAILQKLGCHSQLEAVALAHRIDLVPSSAPTMHQASGRPTHDPS